MKKTVLALLFLFVANATAELKTVPYVDPAQYLRTWYQIARNPHVFERGCVCSRQILGDGGNGLISVYNTCNDQAPTGPLREIRGTATNDDPSTNARFTVDFNLGFKGQYWIIGLDPQYRYAVVSEPSLKTLYILSSTPELSEDLYQQAVAEAALQVDTSQLMKYQQNGCTYPSVIAAAPSAPTDPQHPGSKDYAYRMEKKDVTCSGRSVSVFLPVSTNSIEQFPAVVYGHGQALGVEHYAATFEHLAKKGVAAIVPTYDNGFFDQDWPRMGRDYVTLTDCAVTQVGSRINRSQVIFSGHSKGAYVASIAAGLAESESLPVKAASIVLFEMAGFDSATVGSISQATPVTVVFGDQDSVVKRDLSDSFYNGVKSYRKQFILTKSYSGGPMADHYWPQTKGTFFGGGPEGALHYYGEWKWLVAAGQDLVAGNKADNPYLYGAEAGSKGVSGLTDEITRNY